MRSVAWVLAVLVGGGLLFWLWVWVDGLLWPYEDRDEVRRALGLPTVAKPVYTGGMSETVTTGADMNITTAKAQAVLAEARNRIDAEEQDGIRDSGLIGAVADLETDLFEAEVNHQATLTVYGEVADLVTDYPGADYLNADGTLKEV